MDQIGEESAMEMVKRDQKKERGRALAYLFFLLLAYVLTGLLLLLLAFLLYRFQMGSGAVSASIDAIYFISALFAGVLAGKKAKTRRFLWGTLMGALYFLVLAALSLASGMGNGNTGIFPSFLFCVAGGCVGGILSGLFEKA